MPDGLSLPLRRSRILQQEIEDGHVDSKPDVYRLGDRGSGVVVYLEDICDLLEREF